MKTYRWCYPWANLPDPSQEFVKHDDHAAALAAERAKVRELVDALKLAAIDQEGLFRIADDHHLFDKAKSIGARLQSSRALIEKYKDEPNA